MSAKESAMLGIRINPEDLDRLLKLVEKTPGTTKGSLGREAFLQGLTMLEQKLSALDPKKP